jgi:hypothetical protein
MIYDSIVLELDMRQKESEFQILESMLEDYEKQYMMQNVYQEGIGDERKEYRKSGESLIVSIFKFIGRLINNIIYRIRRLFGYKGKQADSKNLTTSNGNTKPEVTQTVEKTTEKIKEEVKQNPSVIDQYLESHKEDEFEEDGYEIEIVRENKYVSATKKIKVVNASANTTFAVRLKDNVPKIIWADNFDEDGYKKLLTYADNLITTLAEMKKFESSLKASKNSMQGILPWMSKADTINQQIFDNRNCFLNDQKKSEDVENFDKYDNLIKSTLTIMSKLEELHKQQNEMVQSLTSTNTSENIDTQIKMIYETYRRCAARLIKTINDYIAFFEKRGEPEFYLLKKVCNNGDAKKRAKDLSKDLEFTKDIQNMPNYKSFKSNQTDKSQLFKYKEEPPNGMEILHQDPNDIFVRKGQTIVYQMHTPSKDTKTGNSQVRLSVYIMGREGNNDQYTIEHIKKEGGETSTPIDFILQHITDYQTLSDITAGNFDQNKLGLIPEGRQKIITKHADEIKDILDFLTNGKTPLPKKSSKQDVADKSNPKQDIAKKEDNTDVLSIYNSSKRTNDKNNGVEVLTHYYDNNSSKDLIFHKNGNVSLYRDKSSYRIIVFKDGNVPFPTKRILETSSMSLSDIRKAIENNGDGLPELNTKEKREEFVKHIPEIIELFKFFGITINANTSPSTKLKDVKNEPKQIEDPKTSNPKQDIKEETKTKMKDGQYSPKSFGNEVNKQYAEFCKNEIKAISNIISPTAIDKFNKICDNFDEDNDDIEDFVEELRGLVERYLQGSFTQTTDDNWKDIDKVMDNIGFRQCERIKTGVDLNSTISGYRKKASMLFDKPIPVSTNDPDLNFKIKSIQLMPRYFHFISDDGASDVVFVKGSCSYYKYDGSSQKSDNKSQDVKPEKNKSSSEMPKPASRKSYQKGDPIYEIATDVDALDDFDIKNARFVNIKQSITTELSIEDAAEVRAPMIIINREIYPNPKFGDEDGRNSLKSGNNNRDINCTYIKSLKGGEHLKIFEIIGDPRKSLKSFTPALLVKNNLGHRITPGVLKFSD